MDTRFPSESLGDTLSCFDVGTPLTTTEVADSLGIGRRSAYDRLEQLVEHGVLETKKVGAKARVWWRSPPGDDHSGGERSRVPAPLGDRESELTNKVRQQEVIATLGQYALECDDLESVFQEATELVADALDVDYCKVLKLNPTGDSLSLLAGTGWDDGVVGSEKISATATDSQAAYTLSVDAPVVVENLETETRFSGPDLLTSHGVLSGISTVIETADEPWGVLGTHDTSPRSFSRTDTSFVQAIANILSSAIARDDAKRKLRRQRTQLAALNNLYEVVSEINSSIIEQSTPGEIEQTVCDHLAASDSYLFAWIGGIDSVSQTVSSRAEAGVEGYLDEVEISIDPTDERSEGPTGKAFQTGEVQTAKAIDIGTSHDPWREAVDRYEYRSSAAIPIVHEESVYGVLNVYSERPYAFEGQELDVITRLGEIVGHAIAAVERKEALASDELVELGFRMRNFFGEFETEGTIRVDRIIAIDDGRFLAYGTATRDTVETVHRLVEALDHWEAVHFYSDDDPAKFELRMVEPPVASLVSSLGGHIEEAIVTGGDLQLTTHFPSTVDVRAVVDAMNEIAPGTEMLRRRQISRQVDDPRRALASDLTEKQRTTLEAAYHAGFFEWPRSASGEEVAESMGVSAPTFHQHLRKAEQKVFDAMYSTAETES
ncbi:bacterio-opsin activator domain-containing protein [Haloferax namakaokahaiae]|uniref:Bacterio-opsin activator domain-containing protein n=1 Tax=Haloferax namakaokahaiae TaxID=1748331 RepID=A0ABD5ZD96_9EURY